MKRILKKDYFTGGSDSITPEEDRTEREVDLSNLSLSVNMVGITIAIFTFLLFFLYPTSSASSNPLLLQLTLGLNVATIFSFA